MKRSFFFFLISYLYLPTLRTAVSQGANARSFELSDITDTTLKLDVDTTVRKPALIVLQGSLSIPLTIEYPSRLSFHFLPLCP